MQVVGLLMVLLGIGGMFYFLVGFDTSVEVPTTQIADMTVGGGRVNNLGLIGDRQSGIIVSAAAAVLGGILIVIGNMISPVAKPNTKKCPYCAESIQQEAKVCRYCNRDV